MRHSPRKSELAPITLRIADACRITGIGRSKFYELIKAGEVEVIKVGAITLVPMMSIEELLSRGRSTGGDSSFGERLRAAMHPFFANAILTAALAKAPDAIRRELVSADVSKRARAEDALVARLVDGFYEADGDSQRTSG
ncbi:helix-turn-helix domain-containing protein [Stakelama sp. CBK3Z-3]|uniref:Helix-turn-helix domain-containing protein n=2 Tax=Stakelama flava TaxID=2860338 RepID=A0ABS6XQ79_9SPHN|nr:helix-turn-helix domain-containing protein [Stakelama flava]